MLIIIAKNCKLNICEDCLKEHNNKHKIVNFNNIGLNNSEINSFNNLFNEIEKIKKYNKIFILYLNLT
jgi:hypothetical protein